MSDEASIKIFETTLLGSLVADKRKLVHAKSTDSIGSVLSLLKENKIHAVPVYDDAQLLGILSVLDIMTYISFHAFKEDEKPDVVSAIRDLASPVGDLVGKFHEEDKKVWEYEEDLPVLKVLEPMSKGIHRVVVRLASGELKMLTQTDVVRFSHRHLSSITDPHKTLKELELASDKTKLVSMSVDDIALKGFRRMEIEGVSAVPVVNHEGQVVTTLSSADLKEITVENIGFTVLPVVEFLSKIHGEARKPITCTENTTIGQAIQLVDDHRVHRIWVVNENNAPFGALSLSNIINRLQGIDEDLQSRALAVYGRQAMRQLFDTKVLISGMNGLGAEIAKNVILANVNSVTLHDTKNASFADLNSHFYLSEADVGNNRATSCLDKLRELNPSVKVSASTDELNNDLVAQHSVVVLIEVDNDKAIQINEFARSRGIKFIKTDVNGLAGYLFNDFGEGFVVTDTNGEQPHVAVISNIEPDGRVQCIIDERIEFAEGCSVHFTEVKGMTELNDGAPRKIRDVTAYSFMIDSGVEGYGQYISGGIVTEAKLPKTIDFKSFKQCLADPGFLEDPDMSKFGRSNVLHSAFKALDRFQAQKGRLPAPGSEDDAKELITLTSQVVSELPEDCQVGVEGHENAIRKLAHGSRAVLNSLASSFGGIVGQEVIKSATGKFTPFNQWLFLDAFESISDEFHPAEEYEIQNSRYDANIMVFGKTFQQKLGNQRWFLVGSGALGCEFLKNFAMSGIGAGENGAIIVTDDDVIEKSNLSRQFLFRNWHIHKSKSLCAAEAAKAMNPSLNVKPLQERVSPMTENIFNDDFWNNIDGVCNALDNINARLYMDRRCIFYSKPLLESGTLGTKCHSQVVLPHKTQHYGATPDPPEKEAPMCVLHNFPHNIQHCLTWGRSEFGGNFEVAPSEVRKYLTEANYVKSLIDSKISENDIKEKLMVIKDFTKSISTTFEQCIEWARLKFEDYYNNKIKELIFNFPEDAVNKTGGKFWSPPKRFPQPVSFNIEDPTHISFIMSAANLRANIFNVPVPKTNRKASFFVEVLQNIIVPEFVPSKKQIKVEESDKDDLADMTLDELQKSLPPKDALSGLTITPEDFEKDNDYNFHMDFITAASNLRARNYFIEEVDKLRAKLIAGRIIPAIATATALATGLITTELYKIVNDRQVAKDFLSVGDFRCTFNNLAIPVVTITEPSPPAVISDHVETNCPDPLNHPEYIEEEEIVAYPPNHTIWDKIVVNTGKKGITVQEFISFMRENHKLHVDMISVATAKGGGLLLYSKSLKSSHERLGLAFGEIYSSMTGENIAHKNIIVPECIFTDDNMTSVVTPAVHVYI